MSANMIIFFIFIAMGAKVWLRWLKAAADHPAAVGKVIDRIRKL